MKSSYQWLYDERRHVGTDYDSRAEVQNYDRCMLKIRDIQGEIREIMAALDLSRNHTLIEFGAGTGEFAATISEYCREVIAVDISRAMLDFAGEKARSKRRDNIRFVNAGFLNYSHDGEPADTVVTQLALHHLPDFWKQIALIKIHDVLRPGGRLYLRDIVFSLRLDTYEAAFNRVLDNFRSAAGNEMAEKFTNHIRSEYSTFDWIMEEMLYRAGFHIENADYRDNFMAVYLCRKAANE